MEQAERRRLNEQLARLADGDREAFHPVFLTLLPIVRRFAARRVPPADAEDVAQEALVKVFAQAIRFDPERDAVAWAVEIASWELRTWQRRRQRRREDALDETALRAHADQAPTPEDLAAASALDRLLDDVLLTLPRLDRETLGAYANDERPPDVPPATFRKRLERSLKRLRRLLGVEPPHPIRPKADAPREDER